MANKIIFNSRDELLSIDLARVVYFIADGNYTRVILDNKVVCTIGFNLSKMEATLGEYFKNHSGPSFVRTGKSHIINLDRVLQVNIAKTRIVMIGSSENVFTIEASRDAVKKLKELMHNSKNV